jgi:branched-chain amino acid transport system permease protein
MIAERWVNALVLAALVAVPLWAIWADEPFTITLATRVAILALAAVGLNIALGIGGLVSLGHAAFFGLGGYAMGILAFHAQSFSPLEIGPFTLAGTKSMPIIWVTAMVMSALVAWGIGLLSLRTSGVYFIMITLAFGQMFYYFSISWSTYGGEDGLPIWVRNDFPGLNTLDPIQFFGLCLVILCAALFIMARLQRSPFGLALNAARQVPGRVEAVGLFGSVPATSSWPYVIAGVRSPAVAGALWATHLNSFVSPVACSAWHLLGRPDRSGHARRDRPRCNGALMVRALFRGDRLRHWLGGFTHDWQAHGWARSCCLIVLFARGGLSGAFRPRAGAHVNERRSSPRIRNLTQEPLARCKATDDVDA